MNTQYSHNSIIARLDRILNAWDESKHPRDAKGRFTFVVSTRGLFDEQGNMKPAYLRKMKKNIRGEDGEWDKRQQFGRESWSVKQYKDMGYKYINDCLRNGDKLSDVEDAAELDNSCRFSFDVPITAYRGESTFSNYWSNIKAGDSIPESWIKSFVSTSSLTEVAEKFATQKRRWDENGSGKVYETFVTINIPTSKRVGVPSVYTDWEGDEMEITLPYNTKGKVSKITISKPEKIDNWTVVRQEITVDLE